MIPKRQLDPDVLSALKQIKPGSSLQDILAAFILTVLERHHGNRTRTSRELKIPLRTFRHRLRQIESLGYDVIPYQPKRGEVT